MNWKWYVHTHTHTYMYSGEMMKRKNMKLSNNNNEIKACVWFVWLCVSILAFISFRFPFLSFISFLVSFMCGIRSAMCTSCATGAWFWFSIIFFISKAWCVTTTKLFGNTSRCKADGKELLCQVYLLDRHLCTRLQNFYTFILSHYIDEALFTWTKMQSASLVSRGHSVSSTYLEMFKAQYNKKNIDSCIGKTSDISCDVSCQQ